MRLLLWVFIGVINVGCNPQLTTMGQPSRAEQSANAEVFALSTLKASEGDLVKVSGIYLRPGMTVEIAGQTVALNVDSPSSASFIMPKSTVNGNIGALFKSSSNDNVGYLALISDESNIRIPVVDADPALICSDITFQNSTGQLKVGARNCSSGTTVCSRDGEASCITNAAFLAVDVSKLIENKTGFSKDLTVAGIKGTLPKCARDNEDLCITSPEFPAIVKSAITPGQVKAGHIIAGTTGAYPSSSYPLANDPVLPDFTDFGAQLTTNGGFEFFDSFGRRYTGSGDSDLTASNLGAGVTLENLSLQGSIPHLRAPSVELVTQTHNSIQLKLQEQCCFANGILVVRKLASAVSWAPLDGATYTVGADLGDGHTVVAFSNITTLADTGLTPDKRYFYQVWSYDIANRYSTTGNSLETFTYPGANFIAFDYQNEKWVGRRGTWTIGGAPSKPSQQSNRLEFTFEQNNGASIASPMRLYGAPFLVNFDYNVSRDGADGFHFAWGKNITEYESAVPPNGGAMGLLEGAGISGYALKFNIFGTASISVVRLSDSAVLKTENADLKGSIATDRHVKIEIGSRTVDVYLFGSTTPALSYTNATNWQTEDRSVTFGAATGGNYAAFTLSDIQIVQMAY